MNKIQITFGKDKTAIIKGVAIVFMIVLHVFGGSGGYSEDLPMNHNIGLIRFMHSLQICVGIYVFMIGYGYAFSWNKDFKYSVTHIKKLLFTFWTILFLFAVPAALPDVKSGEILILNMFGINLSLSWVSWFVFLYIWAMIVMPFIGRMISLIPYWGFALTILVSLLGQVAIWFFVSNFNNNQWWHALMVCVAWTPTITLGYLFAQKQLFQKIKLPNTIYVTIIALATIFLMLYLKMVLPGIKIINFDIIYAPVIILCILIIFSQYKMVFFSKVVREIGDKSVWMWFIHGLFFTAATRPVYHRFVMLSDNLWIIAVWTIILSYILAAAIKKVIEY